MSVKPVVAVFALGGTIAMRRAAGDEVGVRPDLSVGELLSELSTVSDIATLRYLQFRQAPSASLRVADIEGLTSAIEAAFDDGATGVVVVQGTDTIEETAFLADLLLSHKGAVVFTGAMRPASADGADGPANLVAAIVVAASGRLIDGVTVVFGDEVHAARRVAKTNSSSLGAFESPGAGPIGQIVENRLWVFAHPPARHLTLAGAIVRPAARVALVTLTLDDDGLALRAAAAADGIVLEGFGGGHVPSWLVDDLAGVAQQIPVVLASRTRGGPVLTSTYGFPGSEVDVLATGVISAGDLNGFKARLLLLTLVRRAADRGEIVRTFESYAGA